MRYLLAFLNMHFRNCASPRVAWLLLDYALITDIRLPTVENQVYVDVQDVDINGIVEKIVRYDLILTKRGNKHNVHLRA